MNIPIIAFQKLIDHLIFGFLVLILVGKFKLHILIHCLNYLTILY